MKSNLIFWATIAFVAAGGPTTRSAAADEVEIHAVSSTGLTLEGRVAAADPKVKVIVEPGKGGELPAKLFLVKMSGGKKYRISLDSTDIDSVLVIQDMAGRQLAWDDDSGGGLNSRLTFDPRADGTFKVYAATLKGFGQFTLKVEEEKAVKAQEVGAGFRIKGELGKTLAITYPVNFAAGKSYLIDMITLDDRVLDPLLRLLDAGGKLVAEDDDGGGRLNARIIYKTPAAGTYQIVATCIQKSRGPFILKVREANKDDKLVRNDKAEEFQGKLTKLLKEQRFAEALTLAAQIRAIRQTEDLDTLANKYEAQGQYAKAEPLYRQVLAIYEANKWEKDLNYSTTLDNLAGVYESQGRLDQAEPVYQKCLAMRKEILGEHHPDYATSLNNLAYVYTSREQFRKAQPMYEQALAIYQEAIKKDQPEFTVRYATTLCNLAFLKFARGDFAAAETLYMQALDIRKDVLGVNHQDYPNSLNNLGWLYQSLGNYDKARDAYRQALEIRKAILGERHSDYANSLNSLASLYLAREDYAKAEPLYLRAQEIRKKELGEKHLDYANGLNNLGLLYVAQREFAKAEESFQKALRIREEARAQKHSDHAMTLSNLAAVYQAQQEWAQAEDLYRQAAAIDKEILGPDHPKYAQKLGNLAAVVLARGNSAEAELLLREALRIDKAKLGEKHRAYANDLISLGGFYYGRKEYDKAGPLYLDALAAAQIHKTPVPLCDLRAEDLRIDGHTVTTLNHIAAFLWKSAHKDSAAEYRACERTLLLAIQVLDRVQQESLEERESKVLMTEKMFDVFSHRIRILGRIYAIEKKAQDLEAAFWTIEQGTAQAFLDSLRRNLAAKESPKIQDAEKKLLDSIRLLDARIAKESDRSFDERDPDLIGALLSRRGAAERQLKQFVSELEKEHVQYAALKFPRPCTLEQARACLAPDEVALLFVPGTEGSCLLCVEARPRPGDDANGLAIFELPPAAALTEQLALLSHQPTLASSPRIKSLGREAYKILLSRCQERIKDKHLVIVAGGSLGTLPFELLMSEDGKYLVETHRIRYAPSLTALHLINLWKQQRGQPELPLFAVGDPLYEEGERGAVEPPGAFGRDGKKRWRRLVNSGTEVAAIAKLLGADSAHVLTRAAASEAKVKEAAAAGTLAKARYIHFATHGFLGLDRNQQPALVLNQVGNNGEDGLLDMSEVANLRLNADLVILSACRTGRGRLHRGEGVTGLARAFLFAGSKGVVCSLWSVDDRATADLMVDFYKQLQQGRSAAEALRAAQVAMIRAGKAPLYWAPFIVIGE